MEHYELVAEMPSIERMATQDRLKHARKRRSQQLKRYGQYDKQWEKENSKKKKKEAQQQNSIDSRKKNKKGYIIQFVANIAVLESAARNDLEEGITIFTFNMNFVRGLTISFSREADKVSVIRLTYMYS